MHHPVSSQAEIEALLASTTPAWLLKHSLTCGTSAAALDEFDAHLAAHPEQQAGLLVVQTQRPLSNWVATRFGYVHQSPQLFLLRAGAVIWQGSHWSITAGAMAEALRKAA
ncbi:MAG: bacillithiol system redox-active protein YtxJ [Planctomycetes bacterium]|nr:bacillithiol system redox-active protein YtxJ [Planctomycetota bacterium]